MYEVKLSTYDRALHAKVGGYQETDSDAAGKVGQGILDCFDNDEQGYEWTKTVSALGVAVSIATLRRLGWLSPDFDPEKFANEADKVIEENALHQRLEEIKHA